MLEKKLLLISVTDKEGTKNRFFQETMLNFLKQRDEFKDYTITAHNETVSQNLYNSIDEAITGNTYEGYIIILDCLDTTECVYNPNVMFEFGAIKYFGKPFAVMAANQQEYPFHVRKFNIEPIPSILIQSIEKFYKIQESVVNCVNLINTINIEHKKQIDDFIKRLYKKYQTSLKDNSQKVMNIENKDLYEEILEIKKLLNNTAEYIEGEDAAFTALSDSVRKSKSSLRTTRFANQSIAGENASIAQTEFMENLYGASKRLSDKFERIICNNHPAKWIDIYNILFFGKNGTKVYIRKEDFSIHFELVIIDENIAFIHFYQKDYSVLTDESEQNKNENNVEKINSTLRIQGRSICKKLANIFDRLHHRDCGKDEPKEPSRTLLGIPAQVNIEPKDRNNGCFVVEKNVPNISTYNINKNEGKNRKKYIIDMFKSAFKTWSFEIDVRINRDKVNMVVGIALIEENQKFIDEMRNEQFLNNEEYSEAINKFNKINNEKS